jgi:hypothetical protein
LVEAVPGYTWFIYLGWGVPVLIFALISVWETIIQVKPRTEVAPEGAALAGLAIATFILHCDLPVPIDSRYMVLLLPSVVLFSAAGVNAIVQRVGGARPSINVVRVGLALALIAAFSLESFAPARQLRNGG